MQNKLYVHYLQSENSEKLDKAEEIRNREHDFSCWNPEVPDCPNRQYADHQLTDIDEIGRQYPMCKTCYESWVMG